MIDLLLRGRGPRCVAAGAALLVAAAAALARPAGVPVVAPPPVPTSAASAPGEPVEVSAAARRLYEHARGQLLQIRTLLKTQDSQASVGSGFIVGNDADGLRIVTNYHVVSEYALEPERYRLRFATTDGREGRLELLDVDVRHDLALLRPVADDAALLAGRGALAFRPRANALDKGDRIYSMGNPHDVAFAVVEGNYNGLVERSFDPLIYYAGGINPGMSGGPVLDEQGRVVGVNVSTLLFAQQMSFLVPGPFAEDLYVRSHAAKPLKLPAWPALRQQLLAYQDELVKAFLAQPWESAGHPHYRMPVPEQTYMRCWGSGTPTDAKGLEFQRSQCRMEHALYVNGGLQLGYLDMQHEIYDGGKLGALRFAEAYTASFRNERLGGNSRASTAPYCKEDFVNRGGLPLRAVICLSAYRKLEGLYALNVLVTTVDADTEGALGRFNAYGVSFDNALALSRHYLEGFGWTRKP